MGARDRDRRVVEELRRELARQDAAWAEAKEQLAALGDVTLAIPQEQLEAIEQACARAPAATRDWNAAHAVRA